MNNKSIILPVKNLTICVIGVATWLNHIVMTKIDASIMLILSFLILGTILFTIGIGNIREKAKAKKALKKELDKLVKETINVDFKSSLTRMEKTYDHLPMFYIVVTGLTGLSYLLSLPFIYDTLPDYPENLVQIFLTVHFIVSAMSGALLLLCSIIMMRINDRLNK